MSKGKLVGMVMIGVSGLGLAYILSLVARLLITDNHIAWVICASALVVGVVLILWGINGAPSKPL
jgi:hypothetical protein